MVNAIICDVVMAASCLGARAATSSVVMAAICVLDSARICWEVIRPSWAGVMACICEVLKPAMASERMDASSPVFKLPSCSVVMPDNCVLLSAAICAVLKACSCVVVSAATCEVLITPTLAAERLKICVFLRLLTCASLSA